MDGHVLASPDKIAKKSNVCWDFVKINEYIKFAKIVYDGTRVKWNDNFESLKKFVESAFCQHGKWRASGGSSKSFDAFSGEFRVIWYPGKHNTLTFNGNAGELAKECLMKLCGGCRIGCNESLEDLTLELHILKSRVDAMQVLIDSQGSPKTCEVGDLRGEITLLKLDLEEEKLKNRLLEREVECVQQEIDKIKAYRSNSVGFAENANFINKPLIRSFGEAADACVDGSQILKGGFAEESVNTFLETPNQLVTSPVGNEVTGERGGTSSDCRTCIQQREENDVIIIENNDQLSISDQICIQQHNEKDNAIIKINDHEVLNLNDQTCIQQRSDEENDAFMYSVNSQLSPYNKDVSRHSHSDASVITSNSENMCNSQPISATKLQTPEKSAKEPAQVKSVVNNSSRSLNRPIAYSYESFPALNLPDSFPVSRPAHRNYGQFTSPTVCAGSQNYCSTFSRRPFWDRCHNIPSYRTGYRQYSLEWLVHLSVVSRVMRSKKY